MEEELEPFLEMAEDLWEQWLSGRPPVSSSMAGLFQMSACPEPYLDFSTGPNPLIIVTTNPGGAMSHQEREAIKGGRSPVDPGMTYAEVSREMARYYANNLARDKPAAARRIVAQAEVSAALGYDGVLQIECCPWHSPNLDKEAYLRRLPGDAILSEYQDRLRSFLAPRPVLAISGYDSNGDLGSEKLKLSPWLVWLAELLGVRSAMEPTVPLKIKDGKVTVAVSVFQVNDVQKAWVFSMGHNNFPKEERRSKIVDLFRAARQASAGD